MGDVPEAQLHRRVREQLGPAAENLAGLIGSRARNRVPPALLAAPVGVDPRGLCHELDRLSALRALQLPLGFLGESDGAPRLEQLNALFGDVERLDRLRALELPDEMFDGVPDATIDCWRHRALTGLHLEPAAARLSLLAALCWCRQAELAQELLLVLLAMIEQLHSRALARLHRTSAESRERVLLRLVDSTAHGRSERFSSIGPGLRDLLREADASAGARNSRTALHTSYSSDYRQVVEPLLRALEFRCSDDRCWPLLAALGELLGGGTQVWGDDRYYSADQKIPVRGVVPHGWREVLVDERGRIERVAYELCVLIRLHEAVTRGEITVPWAAAAPGLPGGRVIWPPEAPAQLGTAGEIVPARPG